MSRTAVRRAIDTWDEPSRNLHQLITLCELFPEIKAGERFRAAAELTGAAVILPPKPLLDLPSARVHVRRHLLSKVWDLCLKLEDQTTSDDTVHNVGHATSMAMMLYSREGAEPRLEVDQIADALEQEHAHMLEEIGLQVPDAENSAAVFSIVEHLLRKCARRALDAWTVEREFNALTTKRQ